MYMFVVCVLPSFQRALENHLNSLTVYHFVINIAVDFLVFLMGWKSLAKAHAYTKNHLKIKHKIKSKQKVGFKFISRVCLPIISHFAVCLFISVRGPYLPCRMILVKVILARKIMDCCTVITKANNLCLCMVIEFTHFVQTLLCLNKHSDKFICV